MSSRCLICGLFLLFLTLAAQGEAHEQVSFQNDVMAVLSKAGCNAGACHGNANGKAGFKLSLRGEAPALDHDALTRDQFARRTNPLDPDASLILLKATAQVTHEGGERFKKGSWQYETLRRWIANGTPWDAVGDPQLVRLEVSPTEMLFLAPETPVQIEAQAYFSDGTARDVKSMAVYETANQLVDVTADGLVHAKSAGETVVIVRYLNLQRAVRLAFVPDRPDFQWTSPPERNFIDGHIFAKLRRLKINPSERCDDSTFVRRAYLDLLGILPTAEEARQFVQDVDENKRAQLIEQLLVRPEFADFWALKWADLLQVEERALDTKGVLSFHRWIRDSIESGKPLDQFVREIVAAKGSTYFNPPANFYRANRTPVNRAVNAAQVFMGVRLQCAQCHNHPFDRWTQDDYYRWAGAFAQLDYKVLENRRRDNNDKHEFKGEQIVVVSQKEQMRDPRTDAPVSPQLLGEQGRLLHAAQKPVLDQVADWIASANNPFFAKAQANRIWSQLMGRGIVDPIDDFRMTNPASHPELLDQLAAEFVRTNFDLRAMIRLIMNSQTYQLSSEPNSTNPGDSMNYSRTVPRRLAAEQLLDIQSQALGAPIRFAGQPIGVRAAQLPGTLDERKLARNPDPVELFLDAFGKPSRQLACECERSGETTMSQAFQMISGRTVERLLTDPGNALGKALGASAEPEAIIEELFWRFLTRAPSDAERKRFRTYLVEATDKRGALEDLAWALLNSKEFLLRH